MTIQETKLNRPDVSMANRINAIFCDDPQITTEYINADEEQSAKFVLNVKNPVKAAAIRRILPEEYGKEEIGLPLVVEVKDVSDMSGDIVRAAFDGNPHFKDYIEITSKLTHETFHVCIFKEEVIKFLNDNAGSLNGYEFRLMQDLCEEVMIPQKLVYTTDDGIPYEKNEKKC